MKKVDRLTADRLRRVLRYEADTGRFYWKVARRGLRVGQIAGAISHGYVAIGIDGVKYLGHRLAWLYVHGQWPAVLIDHKNFDRADNRIVNLRAATHSTNKANRPMPANNTTGFKGVSLNKASGLYQASICRDYKQVHLGFFQTAEEAHDAYAKASTELFGEFARPG